jgi:replication factor C small subunit
MGSIDLETPWVEKYRPHSFDDLVSQNIAINNLKQFVLKGNIPHLIFTGPAGTGKTSTALIVAKSMLKSENYALNVLELNASDTVRMEYVRTIIKDFVNQRMVSGGKNLKFILLDEADNIPSQVQQALRRIIEKTSNKVKFILMCNYINKIIDPIISRCAVFRFSNLSRESIIKRLKHIVANENLKIPEKGEKEFYEILYFISGGDLRKAINTLQMAVALELIENINLDEIFKISGFVPNNTFKELINTIKKGEIENAKELIMSIENLDCRNFIRQILQVLPDFNLRKEGLNNVMAFFGDIDYRISQGSDEIIQMVALIAELIENRHH